MFLETILVDAMGTDERARQPGSAVAGRWRNRLGSIMELEVDDRHLVRGTFHSGVGVGDPTIGFEVIGFVEGDAFSFCVDFGRWGSVASWTGHHITDDEHGERLVTIWHLARPVKDPHSEADTWGAVLTGGDEFRRET